MASFPRHPRSWRRDTALSARSVAEKGQGDVLDSGGLYAKNPEVAAPFHAIGGLDGAVFGFEGLRELLGAGRDGLVEPDPDLEFVLAVVADGSVVEEALQRPRARHGDGQRVAEPAVVGGAGSVILLAVLADRQCEGDVGVARRRYFDLPEVASFIDLARGAEGGILRREGAGQVGCGRVDALREEDADVEGAGPSCCLGALFREAVSVSVFGGACCLSDC